MKPFLHFFAFIILCLTSACTPQRLNVFTTFVTRENLASYYVGTPDPCLNNPNVGQRLYVSWRLPTCYLELQPLELKLQIRFYDHKFVTQTLPVTKLTGAYVYSLLNKDFFDSEGMMAYKVELFGNGQLLDEWRHIMWVEPITFDCENESDDKDLKDE